MKRRCGFHSFILGGFECSTHRNRSNTRLDMLAATGHDRCAQRDYETLATCGIRTVRDGLRWHLIEKTPGDYDFSSWLPQLTAARRTGTQVIWDLFHYGWPDWLDIFSVEFVDRFERFARAVARCYAAHTDDPMYLCPTNEISFLSWGGGEAGCMGPFAKGRGYELKRQLVRANITACEAIWSVLPGARMVQIDPVIHITADPKSSTPEWRADAEFHRRLMFQAWDMIAGYDAPELGGAPKYLDIVGVNFYVQNEWLHHGRTIYRSHPLYRPFRDILREVWERYNAPIFVAETGIEDELRSLWLSDVCDEVAAALEDGVPVEGICLYPVVNHPGWEDGRNCCNGMLDCRAREERSDIWQPLADEVRWQAPRLSALRDRCLRRTAHPAPEKVLVYTGI